MPTRLSRYLTRHRITTRQLSERTGYSVYACASWREGVRTPSVGAMRLLAKALGVTDAVCKQLLKS